MAKKVEAPIYWRNGRAYLDARAYSDVGGAQERLVPPGEKLATHDAIIARELAAQRVRELESLRRDKVLHGITRRTELAPFAVYHLEKKAESETVTDQWLESVEMHLRTALGFFGDCDLHTIGVVNVQEYASYLTTIRSRGKPLGPGSRRKYLNSLSNLFRRAAAEEYVLPGYNPVAALMEKPQDKQSEAEWLEVHEAALLLEATRLYVPARGEAIPPQMLHAITATYLLTGGREDEILGLMVPDISFERGTVTIRTNKWRRLKTRNAPPPSRYGLSSSRSSGRTSSIGRSRSGSCSSPRRVASRRRWSLTYGRPSTRQLFLLGSSREPSGRSCFGTPTVQRGCRRWMAALPSPSLR